MHTLIFSGVGSERYELSPRYDCHALGLEGSTAAAVIFAARRELLEHPEFPSWSARSHLGRDDRACIEALAREVARGRAGAFVLRRVDVERVVDLFGPPLTEPSLADLVTDEPEPCPPPEAIEPTFFAMRIVDARGRSFAGTPVRIRLPDGSEQDATLDEHSSVRVDEVSRPGTVSVYFVDGLQRNDDAPALDGWQPEPTDTGIAESDDSVAAATGSEHTAVVEVPPPHVVIFDTGGLCFGTDREILVPAYLDGRTGLPNHHFMTGLDVIRSVVEHLRRHPEQRVCVVGHTDTVGSATSNVELSQRRAESVRLFLANDRQGWAALAVDNQTVADWQLVLRWAHLVMGMNCDPGEIDDCLGQRTQSALHRFRSAFNVRYGGQLAIEGPFVAADWAAVFDCYIRNLAEQFGSPWTLGDPLCDVTLGEPAVLACGEAFPAESPGLDDRPSARNRRVDIVLYDPANAPTFDTEETATGIYGAATDCVRSYGAATPSAFAMARFALQDGSGEPLRRHSCQLIIGDAVLNGSTVDSGYAEFVVPAEPASATLVIADRVGARRQEREIQLGGLASVAEEAGVQGRLHNLGFDANSPEDAALHRAVSDFQAHCAMPVTGEVQDETRRALALHHGC